MSRNNTALLVLCAAVVSLVVAIVAGVIFVATGKTELEALLYGGGAFGVSMLVCVGVIAVL
ncbi:hypothetical protein ACFWHW_31700 [Streptomyces pharetrae]|uniref:hypothetical protein n=1 Tax=Streptomyces pharetrae TaxID=291370 RepID=UPI003658C919